MTSQQQQVSMTTYDPITLAILSKMVGQSDSSEKWLQLLMQMYQQMQQQYMQTMMLMLSMMPKQQQDTITPIIQLMGQNMQLSQQQMQSFMQMLQNQYQQTLQLQKEAMEKSEKRLKEELKETMDELSEAMSMMANALSKAQAQPRDKDALNEFLEQVDKIYKIKQKIEQVFYSAPELIEKYKTPEGKPDYGALIIDMIGRNLSQALEVLKYKYMTDMQRAQPVLQPAPQPVQIQPVQQVQRIETPKVQETPKIETKPPAPQKEETLGRLITEGPSPSTQVIETKGAKKPPI